MAGRNFLKNDPRELENHWRHWLPIDSGKFLPATVEVPASQHLKDFWMKLVAILTTGTFLIRYNETCQYLEDLRDSENQYFPHDRCVKLQNHSCIQSQSKCNRERQMWTEQSPKEVMDTASEATLQIILRQPPLVEFWCIIKQEYHKYMEKSLNHSSVLLLHICERPSFYHVPQPKLVIQGACGWVERQLENPAV